MKANGRTLAGDSWGVRGGLRELRIYGERLLGAALAGYEDADALDHFSGGAGSFWQEDVGRAGTVEGVDGAGDDHGGQARVKLLSATDKLVAIHLWHQK